MPTRSRIVSDGSSSLKLVGIKCIDVGEQERDQVTRYKLAFTTGGLFASEARIIARVHDESPDWGQTRAQVGQDNPLGLRTAASVTRVSKEIVDRLQTLNPDELALVLDGSASERNAIMWLAATRQYRLIEEFASEILRERYLSMTPSLDLNHFDTFLASKAAWSPEIADLADSTRRKLRQNLFRMLREAELLSPGGAIQPAFLNDHLLQVLRPSGKEALSVFPLTDEQIAQALR